MSDRVNLKGNSTVGVDVRLGAQDMNSNYQMNVSPSVNVGVPNTYGNPSASVNIGGGYAVGGNVGAVNVQVGAPVIDQETPYHLCGKPYPLVSSGVASCSICLNLLYPGFGTYIIGCKGSTSSNCCFWICMGKDLIYYFRLSSKHA